MKKIIFALLVLSNTSNASIIVCPKYENKEIKIAPKELYSIEINGDSELDEIYLMVNQSFKETTLEKISLRRIKNGKFVFFTDLKTEDAEKGYKGSQVFLSSKVNLEEYEFLIRYTTANGSCITSADTFVIKLPLNRFKNLRSLGHVKSARPF